MVINLILIRISGNSKHQIPNKSQNPNNKSQTPSAWYFAQLQLSNDKAKVVGTIRVDL
jgi:hypothetical protein